MPFRLCLEPQCRMRATYRGRCTVHARARNAETHRNRHVYNSKLWAMRRRQVLLEQPICQACDQALSEHVDHILDLAKGGQPFDRANLQGLCPRCHGQKTKREQSIRG